MIAKISTLHTMVDGESATEIIAQVEGRFVGSAKLSGLGTRSACLCRLFVDLHFRREGIGRQLVDNAAAIALNHSAETLALNLDAMNRETESFYAKLGFQFAYRYADGDVLLFLKL